jgi:hypothetical protein
MQLRKISFIGCLITFFITTISFSQVLLEIKNVNTVAGTLDIYMTNQSGCSYCSDDTYDNENGCESYGSSDGGTTIDGIWLFDPEMDGAACTTANGKYFDGNVAGFQITIPAITITGASGGLAESNDMTVQVNDDKASKILGFSLSGGTIPESDGLLTTVTFSAVNSTGIICIPLQEDCGITGNPHNCIDLAGNDSIDGTDNTPVMSDPNYIQIPTQVGPCWCGSSGGDQYMGCDDACSLTPVLEDCADVCGGTSVDDAIGVCGGDCQTDADGNGVCDDMAITQISSYIPDKFSISQNYPNPFNPITSIIFDVVQMDKVSLVVYDLTGKEIATLVSGVYMPGSYIVEWNAQNNTGHDVASGMYIYRYINNEEAITRKMLYLK